MLDPTFGTGGQVVATFAQTNGVSGLVLQPDGKLVAAGNSGASLVLQRYNSDGTLDPGFGTAGTVTTTLGLTDGFLGAKVALQADGKILVMGTTGSPLSIVVARFLPSGVLDSSFGSAGQTTIGPGVTPGANVDEGGITVQSDGKIVVAGITTSSMLISSTVVVARLNTDGTIDTGFGSNGRAQTTISGDATPVPVGVGVEPNGRIITVTINGNVNFPGSQQSGGFLVGFTAGGVLDQGFGTTGPALNPGAADRGISPFTTPTPRGFTILPDGRIVVVGFVNGAGGAGNFAIARFFANGILDAAFGQAGTTSTDFGAGQNAGAVAVAVQPDGRYVAAGTSQNSSFHDSFALARYNPNGSLDTSFGIGGTVLTAFARQDSMAHQVLVQPDGRAVAAGVDGTDFALARYLQDIPLPTANQRFVGQVYLDLLGRPVDGNGLAQWSAMLDQGASRMQVVQQIQASQEFLTGEVTSLYAQYLHRSVDPTGLNGFLSFLRSGGTIEQLVSILVSSPEFRQGQGGGTNDGFLTALYQDALDRAVDSVGRSSWDQAFANGASSVQVAGAILASTEYRQDVVEQGYGLYLRRQADSIGLSNFTTMLNNGTRDEVVFAIIISSLEYLQRI
jgi:uncharacterized delta-60 repeat protein